MDNFERLLNEAFSSEPTIGLNDLIAAIRTRSVDAEHAALATKYIQMWRGDVARYMIEIGDATDEAINDISKLQQIREIYESFVVYAKAIAKATRSLGASLDAVGNDSIGKQLLEAEKYANSDPEYAQLSLRRLKYEVDGIADDWLLYSATGKNRMQHLDSNIDPSELANLPRIARPTGKTKTSIDPMK